MAASLLQGLSLTAAWVQLKVPPELATADFTGITLSARGRLPAS